MGYELRSLPNYHMKVLYIKDCVLGSCIVMDENLKETTFVLVTDQGYFSKAKKTIVELRSKGRWWGSVVLIAIDFEPPVNFLTFYEITCVHFPTIDLSQLLKTIGKGFSDGDGRELNKTNQWEKLHVFESYFKQWKRVILMDAGTHILNSVDPLLALDYHQKLLAPTDDSGDPTKIKPFRLQLSHDHPDVLARLLQDFGAEILECSYFLNGLFIYDTNLLEFITMGQLIETMNQYPICKTNEMTLMNIVFNFKYHVWTPFPQKTPTGKYLFDWSEANHPRTHWTQYCFLKYPITIEWNDT